MQGNRMDVIAVAYDAIVGIEQFRLRQRMQLRGNTLADVINPIDV